MGQMADGGHHPVVLPVVQHHGDSADDPGHSQDAPYIFRLLLKGQGTVCAHGRRHDVVGVFQQMVRGIFISRLFRARHGVASHEAVLQALARDLLVDAGLGAAHVRDQGALL